MAINNDHTVHPILSTQPEEVLTTLNHNFQVFTERIKDLNISLSYLDVLKITTIFTPQNTDPDQNLQNFVSQCWNTLANYAGVYIGNNGSSNSYFTWMDQYNVKAGDFIIKLPNNQSLYLPGPQPKYMIPTAYDKSTNQITFTPAENADEKLIKLDLTNIPTAYLDVHTANKHANDIIDSDYKDCRFYTNSGEEIFFADYRPDDDEHPFSLPIDCKVQYLGSVVTSESVGE